MPGDRGATHDIVPFCFSRAGKQLSDASQARIRVITLHAERRDHWKYQCNNQMHMVPITAYKIMHLNIDQKHGSAVLGQGTVVVPWLKDKRPGRHRAHLPYCQWGPEAGLLWKQKAGASTQYRDRILWSQPTRTLGQPSSHLISYFCPMTPRHALKSVTHFVTRLS